MSEVCGYETKAKGHCKILIKPGKCCRIHTSRCVPEPSQVVKKAPKSTKKASVEAPKSTKKASVEAPKSTKKASSKSTEQTSSTESPVQIPKSKKVAKGRKKPKVLHLKSKTSSSESPVKSKSPSKSKSKSKTPVKSKSPSKSKSPVKSKSKSETPSKSKSPVKSKSKSPVKSPAKTKIQDESMIGEFIIDVEEEEVQEQRFEPRESGYQSAYKGKRCNVLLADGTTCPIYVYPGLSCPDHPFRTVPGETGSLECGALLDAPTWREANITGEPEGEGNVCRILVAPGFTCPKHPYRYALVDPDPFKKARRCGEKTQRGDCPTWLWPGESCPIHPERYENIKCDKLDRETNKTCGRIIPRYGACPVHPTSVDPSSNEPEDKGLKVFLLRRGIFDYISENPRILRGVTHFLINQSPEKILKKYREYPQVKSKEWAMSVADMYAGIDFGILYLDGSIIAIAFIEPQYATDDVGYGKRERYRAHRYIQDIVIHPSFFKIQMGRQTHYADKYLLQGIADRYLKLHNTLGLHVAVKEFNSRTFVPSRDDPRSRMHHNQLKSYEQAGYFIHWADSNLWVNPEEKAKKLEKKKTVE